MITHIEGAPIHNASEFYKMVDENDSLKLTVVRNEESLSFIVVPDTVR